MEKKTSKNILLIIMGELILAEIVASVISVFDGSAVFKQILTADKIVAIIAP